MRLKLYQAQVLLRLRFMLGFMLGLMFGLRLRLGFGVWIGVLLTFLVGWVEWVDGWEVGDLESIANLNSSGS